MSHPKYILKTTKNEKFHFNLTAKNGQVILTSQTYVSKPSAINGIVSVQINSSNEDRFERSRSENGQYFFNLKANNGQVIGTSELYTTAEAREAGIESVKTNGYTTEVDDHTL